MRNEDTEKKANVDVFFQKIFFIVSTYMWFG